ncbi:uncharacterized protein BDR25DRAFT_334347 [Lindgomyces ingoldianus]|uniref:Uncharacterized protein n=1 Tax=Lindgomyces ingoldianus TaxID=673940 RepID=A0ACB6QV48_9PLEO|nr:uncharacterized protein BDR25DRAFT_334347 [Lindgomyces ingoldianus]KAF2470775.1 hypothetical protein BDR25DRAFT_334347 [Lindgomyces ingoldianus]
MRPPTWTTQPPGHREQPQASHQSSQDYRTSADPWAKGDQRRVDEAEHWGEMKWDGAYLLTKIRPVSAYTNGHILVNENNASAGGQHSPVHAIEKMEGGFSKALLLRKEDGSEIIAKIPFSIARLPKYTTASEVAVLQYQYIIMEKAAGIQLFKTWGAMSEYDQFCLVKQLTKLEGELAALRFPASGSLYLCESMADDDIYVALDPGMEPSGQFCIGPSCERGWYAQSKTTSSHSPFNRGPWSNLSSFGIALVERETARIEQNPTSATPDPPRGSFSQQIAVLKMANDVIIYVPNEDPTQITSLIDWQSIVVSPLFLQARFPEFLSVDEDYALGSELPGLPQNYNQMDADDKEIAEFKLREAKLAKAYELSTLFIPSFLRELFIRCGEASEGGVIPLRACIIQLSEVWNDVGFTGKCPFSFSEDDMQKHDLQFEEYRDLHRVQEIARKHLDTDSEG